MFLAGLEPATFRVLSGCDNHYTTETTLIPFALTWHTFSLAPEMHRLNFDRFDVKRTVGVKTGPAATFNLLLFSHNVRMDGCHGWTGVPGLSIRVAFLSLIEHLFNLGAYPQA